LPELPEVETTMRGISPLVGQSVQQVIIRHPTLRWPIPTHLVSDLPNLTLTKLKRRAKYILAEFRRTNDELIGTLILHLGMSGRICLLAKDEPVAKHDHFDIHFKNGQVLRLRDPRRFGAVLWVAADVDGDDIGQHALIKSLGPEPLESGFSADYLYKQLRTRTAPIKTTIMDSNLVVGVGNIYASESLFRSGINPKTPANKVSKPKCERLVAQIKATLAEAIEAGGSSLRDFFGADGNPGYFQQTYFVYGRTGEPCRVCQKPILQIKQGQRSTFYCVNCQR
jgi:formamidopyrimidine-DNA glycosylase